MVLTEETLAQLKSNDPSSIASMTVQFDDDGFAHSIDWEREGHLIGGNTHLKKLCISTNHGYDADIVCGGNFEAFCRGVANNRSIETLILFYIQLSLEVTFAILSQFFEHNGNLISLEVRDCELIDASNGIRILTSALSGRRNKDSLEMIELAFTGANNESMGELMSVLRGYDNLTELSLNGNDIGGEVRVSLANVLQEPRSNLKYLDLEFCDNIDDEALTAFADALAHNTNLHTLMLGGWRADGAITSRGWDAFFNLLCNKSSIDATYTSNHTLCGVSRLESLPDGLAYFLQLNGNSNKAEVARQKILKYHFLAGGDINIQEFVAMEMKVLPHAIAWIGRDDAGNSLLYNFFHGRPSLFELGDNSKATTTKRKRGTY